MLIWSRLKLSLFSSSHCPCDNKISLTKPFQSISHSLVFHHVNESPTQAEVGEDEEDRLQDVIDVVQLLLIKNQVLVSHLSRKQPPPAKCNPCCDSPPPSPNTATPQNFKD